MTTLSIDTQELFTLIADCSSLVAATVAVITLFVIMTRGRSEDKQKAIDRFKSRDGYTGASEAESDLIALQQYLRCQLYIETSKPPKSLVDVFNSPVNYNNAATCGLRVILQDGNFLTEKEIEKVPIVSLIDVEKKLDRLINSRLDVLVELASLGVKRYHFEEHLNALYSVVHSVNALLLGELKPNRANQLNRLRALKGKVERV